MATEEPPSAEHILQVGLGFWASKALLSAVEMEVFTELSKRPEDLETLRGRLGLHPRAARDFLDTLVALGFLRRAEGKYSNAPATDFYLDKHKPSYIGGHAGNGEPAPVPPLEPPLRGAAHGKAAERGPRTSPVSPRRLRRSTPTLPG